MAVVVPVFNRVELLRATIESLRAQTLGSAQFILVDDRSDADVWTFLNSLPALDDRFVVMRKPDHIERGCQASRNIGLDAARAESVVFLDSDDLLVASCLEDWYDALVEQPQADIIVGRQAIFDSTGAFWVNVPKQGESDLERMFRLANPVDVPWVNGGVLIRRSSLLQSGVRWRPEFDWDDVAFHFECLMAGLVPFWVPRDDDPDAYYRNHSGNRYGQTLAQAEGLLNATSMLCWMKHKIDHDTNFDERTLDLAVSFFHACALRAIDARDFSRVTSLLDQAAGCGLISAADARRIQRFARGRMLLGWAPRLSYYWDRWIRTSSLRRYFRTADSSYGAVAARGPTTELAR